MFLAKEILDKIPHRPPLLMLDGILDHGDTHIRAFKNVSVNESHFRGHFPDAPVMPGVLVMEGLMQLAWYFFADQGKVRLKRVKRLKFRRSVVPGDRLELEINILAKEDGLDKFRGTAKLEGKTAVEGDFWIEVVPKVTGS